MAEIARVEKLPLPHEPEALRSLVQITGDESVTVAEFLGKFKSIRQFFRSREIIQRFVEEAVEDAALDSVRALELRFTPAALAQAGGFRLDEVTDWVLSAARSAGTSYGVEVACVLSVNRHEPVKIAEAVTEIAIDRVKNGVTAMDLAGDEAGFPSAPFEGLILKAKGAGIGITVHAGEWSGSENVRTAIERLQADRIGHGIHVLEDPEVTQAAAQRGVVFEVSLTSNWKTGAVPDRGSHPLSEMIQAGLSIAIATDDPLIFDTTLSAELMLAQDEFDMSLDIVKAFNMTALQAMFLDARAKKALETELVDAYWGAEGSSA